MTCWMVAGLAFGDEGKGATVAAIVQEYGADLIIRYNGGAQCAHNVVTPEGRHHTFAQFGSGSFTPGVKTFLSKHVIVNPASMLVEAAKLDRVGVTDVLQRTTVDPRALVITPFHRALNRLQEVSRGNSKHGSTGMGIGVTRDLYLKYGADVLLIGDLADPDSVRDKMLFIRKLCSDRAAMLNNDKLNPTVVRELRVLGNDYQNNITWYQGIYKSWLDSGVTISTRPPIYKGIVFEGAQGMLLDEKYGFGNHTTWTNITFANAFQVLEEIEYQGSVHRIGVLRSFFTRHGAGPFPSEDNHSLIGLYKEEHNEEEYYTGKFRMGSFDVNLARYAIDSIGGINSLAINHLDIAALMGKVPIFAKDGIELIDEAIFPDVIQTLLDTDVNIRGYGPSYKHRIFGRVNKDRIDALIH